MGEYVCVGGVYTVYSHYVCIEDDDVLSIYIVYIVYEYSHYSRTRWRIKKKLTLNQSVAHLHTIAGNMKKREITKDHSILFKKIEYIQSNKFLIHF